VRRVRRAIRNADPTTRNPLSSITQVEGSGTAGAGVGVSVPVPGFPAPGVPEPGVPGVPPPGVVPAKPDDPDPGC
jgi:hypothetical protein